MKHQKWFAGITGMVLTASIIAGCGSSTKEQSANGSPTTPTGSKEGTKPVTISINSWPGPNDAQLKKYQNWQEEFQSENPNITIIGDTSVYDPNSFFVKAVGGQLPNVYATYLTEPQKIINGGFAADITDTMKKWGYDKAVNPQLLKFVSKDGKIYGLPSEPYVMGIVYNVNLLKQAGLTDASGVPKFPKTYDELAQMAQTIKEKTGKPGFLLATKSGQGGWQFVNLGYSFGVEFEKQVGGKWQAAFNSPEGVQALQFIKDLKWKYNALPDNTLVDVTNDMFKMIGTDQLGMAFGLGVWNKIIVDNFKLSKDNMAMSSVPAGPKGKFAVTGGGVWMFSNVSTPEQVEAGFKWLKKTGISPEVTPDVLKSMEEQYKTEAEKGHPVGLMKLPVWVNAERIKAEKDIVDKYTNVNMKLWNDYMNYSGLTILPEPPMNAQELYKALDVAIQTVISDKNANPKAILDQVAADFQRDYLDKAK